MDSTMNMDSTVNAADDRSLGELVASATRDLSQLVHQEIELAKAEITKEVKTAGAGAGLFGGAGFAGVLALIFLSISLAYGISWLGIGLGWGFFLVGLLYLITAAVLGLTGKKKISQVGPPERTISTAKDGIAWAKNPTSTEAARAGATR